MKNNIYTLVIESRLRKSIQNLPTSISYDCGWGNGYILIPEYHPFYGKHYDDIDINIHGGLTYSNKFESDNFFNWIKNLEIDGDITLNNYKEFDGYWMFGFDTAHSGDNVFNCSKQYVINETENLLNQCINIKGYKRKLRKEKLEKLEKL